MSQTLKKRSNLERDFFDEFVRDFDIKFRINDHAYSKKIEK